MITEKLTPVATAEPVDFRAGETLIRMLVSGLVLITIGMIAVMLLV